MTEIYSSDVTVTMRGVSDPIGLPYTVNPLELAERDALIEVREGPTGGPGSEGAPAWPWTWQGDIADFATLEALPLTTADARKAWRVVAENALYVWTGVDWVRFLDAFLAPGKQGPPTLLTGSAVAGAVGSSADAEITGAAPNQTLEITFPRGAVGPEGDPGTAGAIADAADVADITDARDGSILSWSGTDDLWHPTPDPKLSGPWSIAGSQFAGASNVSATERVVATMTLPAQPVAYRPIVMSGHLSVKVHVSALDDTRLILDIRLGSATGPIIGFGYPLSAPNSTDITFCPRWEQPITPDSTHATVAANQTATIYVSITKTAGSRTYTVVTQGAQLLIMAQPLRDQT